MWRVVTPAGQRNSSKASVQAPRNRSKAGGTVKSLSHLRNYLRLASRSGPVDASINEGIPHLHFSGSGKLGALQELWLPWPSSSRRSQ